jgi:cobalt-zinc-cadmium efflux system outer membrane protein
MESMAGRHLPNRTGMRIIYSSLALAVSVRVASAQATTTSASATSPTPAECRVPAGATVGGSADSLCLSRTGAITRALAANPQLAVASALVAQARARKVQGTAIPDPAFAAAVDQSRNIFGSNGMAAGRTMYATLTVPFPDKFRLQGKIGSADVQGSRYDSIQTWQALAAATSQGYDALLASLRRQRDLQEARRLAAEFLEKTKSRFEAGTVARIDVVKAQVDLAQADNDLIAAGSEVQTARASLNRFLGRSLGAPIATADTLAIPPPLPALADLEAWAMTHRPEVGSLDSQAEGARAAVSLAKEFWLPDITIGVGKDWADPGPGVLTTGLSLPIPVFYWQHARGEIAEARSHVTELAATRRDLEAAIGEEVRALRAAADVALRQATWLRDQVLPSAQEAYRIATVSYGLGGSSALEVLDARRTLLDAENQFTDALAAANSARADLERAVAGPLASFRSGANDDR